MKRVAAILGLGVLMLALAVLEVGNDTLASGTGEDRIFTGKGFDFVFAADGDRDVINFWNLREGVS